MAIYGASLERGSRRSSEFMVLARSEVDVLTPDRGYCGTGVAFGVFSAPM